MYMILWSIPVIMAIIVIRLFADEVKSTQKEDLEKPTISDIAEWRYGRDAREYKDISEYYVLEKTIKFP